MEEVGLTSGSRGQGEGTKNLEVKVQKGPAQAALRPAQQNRAVYLELEDAHLSSPHPPCLSGFCFMIC